MNERLLEIRTLKKMNQEEFGSRINLSKFAISGFEKGKRAITDRVINDICREFNVNEEWLRIGEGEMFEEILQEDEYFKAATQISKNNDELAMNMVIEYWKLDEESKETFRKFIKSISKNLKEEQD